jgi:hypothetical protein
VRWTIGSGPYPCPAAGSTGTWCSQGVLNGERLVPAAAAELDRVGLRPREVALDGGFFPLGVAENLPDPKRVFIAGRQSAGPSRTDRRLARSASASKTHQPPQTPQRPQTITPQRPSRPQNLGRPGRSSPTTSTHSPSEPSDHNPVRNHPTGHHPNAEKGRALTQRGRFLTRLSAASSQRNFALAAEGVGFEPTVPVDPVSGFQDRADLALDRAFWGVRANMRGCLAGIRSPAANFCDSPVAWDDSAPTDLLDPPRPAADASGLRRTWIPHLPSTGS